MKVLSPDALPLSLCCWYQTVSVPLAAVTVGETNGTSLHEPTQWLHKEFTQIVHYNKCVPIAVEVKGLIFTLSMHFLMVNLNFTGSSLQNPDFHLKRTAPNFILTQETQNVPQTPVLEGLPLVKPVNHLSVEGRDQTQVKLEQRSYTVHPKDVLPHTLQASNMSISLSTQQVSSATLQTSNISD